MNNALTCETIALASETIALTCETIAFAGETIATPSTPKEWCVATLPP